jgi:hypothetical protein
MTAYQLPLWQPAAGLPAAISQAREVPPPGSTSIRVNPCSVRNWWDEDALISLLSAPLEAFLTEMRRNAIDL